MDFSEVSLSAMNRFAFRMFREGQEFDVFDLI